MEKYNAYSKYGPLGVCGYLKDEYGKFFKNDRLPSLTNIPVPEGSTSPAQGKYDNGEPPRGDGRKCYTCGGNNLCPDCLQLKQSNSRSHGGRGGYGSGGHGHGRGNGDRGGGRNGAVSNTTTDSRDVIRKPMAAWKHIHTVDGNIVIDEISDTTWKFYKNGVCSVTVTAGFYNRSHTTSEHSACAPKVDPPQSQYNDTPTLEINFASSSDPSWNI